VLSVLIVAASVALCTLAALISIGSIWQLTRARPEDTDTALPPLPPLSVLKPLCGADDSLEKNLETFFAQRYPDFELIFGVESGADAAIAVVRKLIAQHPGVRARLAIHGRRGLNPKVANLRGILEAGARDLVVISDSNIAVAPDYLARLARKFTADPAREPGLVTNLFAGVGARSRGARLESLQLDGPVAGGIASSEILSGGSAVLVGKSMIFRRSRFESLGGLESLSSVLAEDYVMGRMFKEAGYPVRVCSEVVRNVTVHTSVRAFFLRQLRWAMLRSRIKPLLYPFELLLNPIAVALFSFALGSGAWVFAWAFTLTLLRDLLQWLRLSGPRGIGAVGLGVVKDLLMIAAWALAPFSGTVVWRGHKLRVSAGTRVYAGAPVVDGCRPRP
jgi:ceramide glucosyltransferase